MKNEVQKILILPGEGLGPDTTTAARRVVQTVSDKTGRAVEFFERPLWIGTEDTVNQHWRTDLDEAITFGNEIGFIDKGPTNTLTGGGIRSLNLLVRNGYGTSVCIRPMVHYPGVQTPLKDPSRYDGLVVVREMSEGLYSAIEAMPGTDQSTEMQDFLHTKLGFSENQVKYSKNMGFSVKIASEERCKDLTRAGIEYAFSMKLKAVSMIHKGNILKATEAQLVKWGREVAIQEYGARFVEKNGGVHVYEITKGEHTIRFDDNLADSGFITILNYPEEYGVLIMSNLNGDYYSDALTGWIGTLGLAAGININPHNGTILCEPTGGTGMGKNPLGPNQANPIAAIVSMMMGLAVKGWQREYEIVLSTIKEVVASKQVTFDIGRMIGLTKAECLGTREFTDVLIEALKKKKFPLLNQQTMV